MAFDAGGSAEVGEGTLRAVERDGAKVLLARSGGRCHALGAKCPHNGAPLEKGVLDGDRLICPWHKAAFRLADGARLEPPALTGIPAFAVEERDGRIMVGGELERPEPARTGENRVVAIVGAGAAGSAAAQALREEGFAGRVVLIGAEDRAPYDRTALSKAALSGDSAEAAKPLFEDNWFEANAVERRAAVVSGLDPAARRAVFDDGSVLDFDAALLAPGGEPKRLDVPGAELPGVFTLRTPDDAEAILARADGARRVVVAGSGFIGMEAAGSLRQRGLEVTVVSPERVPFEKQLGAEVGAIFRRVHESKGVRFLGGEEVVAVTGDLTVQGVRLKSGEELGADLLLVGLGVSPRTGMLEGVPLREDGGVAVDGAMRVTGELFAAGDVAAFPFRGEPIRVEHWRVAEQHGRVAAKGLMGLSGRFDAVPYFWTMHYGKRLDYVGHASDWDEFVLDGDAEKPEFVAFYAKGGRVRAVAGWGRDQAMARAVGLMTHREDWTVPALRDALAG